MATKYYVVWQGRETGVFTDWATCKKHIDKFAGAKYKSFKTQAEANAAFSGSNTPAVASATGSSPSAPARKKSSAATVKTYTAKEIAALDLDIEIYTDGGCDPNPGKAGSGLALYRQSQLSELWYGLYNPNGTNNTAELHALHQALVMAEAELKQSDSIAIFCDSKYAIQCVTQWAVGWEKKGWKKPGGEIKNLELIQTMFALHQKIKDRIQVLHVNGHVGVQGNELADRMSILAIGEKTLDFVRYTDALDLKAILAMREG